MPYHYRGRHLDPTRVGGIRSNVVLERMKELQRIGEKREKSKMQAMIAGGKAGGKVLFSEMPARTEAMLSEGGRERYKGLGGFFKWMTDPAKVQSDFIQKGIDKGWTKEEADFIRSKTGLRGAFNKYIKPPLAKVGGLVSDSAYGLYPLEGTRKRGSLIRKGVEPEATPEEKFSYRIRKGDTLAEQKAHAQSVEKMYADNEQALMDEFEGIATRGPTDPMGERYEAGKLKQYTRSRDPLEVTKPPIFEKDTTIMDWWESQDKPVSMDMPIDMSASTIPKPYIPFEQTPEFQSRKERLWDESGKRSAQQMTGEDWYDEKGDFHRGSKYRETFNIEEGIPEEGPIDPLWKERKHWEDKGGLENMFDRLERGTKEHEWLKKEGLLGGQGKGILSDEDIDELIRGGIGGTPESNYLPSPMQKFLNPPEVLPDVGGEVIEEVGTDLAEEAGTKLAQEVGTKLAQEVTTDVAGEAIKEETASAIPGIGPALDVYSVFTDPEERDFGDIAGKALKAGAPATGPFAPLTYGIGMLMDMFS